MIGTAMNERPDITQKQAPGTDAYRRLIGKLPVTMRPALNQQFTEWEMLFPYERNRVVTFMKGVETYSPSALDSLTAPLWALEDKMGVKHWDFTQAVDTIENASQLARSAYYAEWRREVQRVVDAISAAARDVTPAPVESTRLMLIVLPANLPVDPQSVWKQWDPKGHEIKITGSTEKLCQLVIQGQPGLDGIATLAARQGAQDSSDLWLIDSEAKLHGMLSQQAPIAAFSLSFSNLKPLRDKFLAELNKAPKDIEATDQIIANLRSEAWGGWGLWPPEVDSQPRLKRFLIDLILSGNGVLIFSNSFVEWTAAEVRRRARPRTIVARFGMRIKPKPFTSIAIFENQQKVSSLPDVDDPENSAIDAAILARYSWLAASRYPEQDHTICVCVAEHVDSAYVILPEGKSLGWAPDHAVAPEELYGWLGKQFIA
jgi:hypothetical protein